MISVGFVGIIGASNTVDIIEDIENDSHFYSSKTVQEYFEYTSGNQTHYGKTSFKYINEDNSPKYVIEVKTNLYTDKSYSSSSILSSMHVITQNHPSQKPHAELIEYDKNHKRKHKSTSETDDNLKQFLDKYSKIEYVVKESNIDNNDLEKSIKDNVFKFEGHKLDRSVVEVSTYCGFKYKIFREMDSQGVEKQYILFTAPAANENEGPRSDETKKVCIDDMSKADEKDADLLMEMIQAMKSLEVDFVVSISATIIFAILATAT
jgi:hypothetical protein